MYSNFGLYSNTLKGFLSYLCFNFNYHLTHLAQPYSNYVTGDFQKQAPLVMNNYILIYSFEVI